MHRLVMPHTAVYHLEESVQNKQTKHKTQQLVTVNSQFGKCKLMRLLYFPAGKQQYGKYKLEQS